ncbi:hypothetical protein [Bacillus sp. B15-48]|uniref:hypothetical protein n=1 Tax=Bacillus sp. B15-48 TaxID=1548601 RepID=UPI00194014BB|nr:hypothetical protein [Bacillus sp. B15-48]MBM4765227.1 hypothetical protein [Bacillus sp. B15-48]
MNNPSMNLNDWAKLGVKYEMRVNALIQKMLNDKRCIEITNEGIKKHVKCVKLLRQFNESITELLNLPTKDDIARVARLTMQLEEKLDQMEDLLYELQEGKQTERSQKKQMKTKKKKKKEKEKKTEKEQASKEEQREKRNPFMCLPDCVHSSFKKIGSNIYSVIGGEFLKTFEQTLEEMLQRRSRRSRV